MNWGLAVLVTVRQCDLMYDEDSFFTLGVGGQIGLICMSFALTLLVLFAAKRLMRGHGLVVKLGIAAGSFALFVWLSPQIYYAYYRVIFEGLPAQWVIGWPPLIEAVRKASFTGPANLSAHGQGVLFWLLIGLALRRSGRRDPSL